MASHKKERTDLPAEAPKKRDESEEQSLARYATTVGIVTGLFGMLFGVGFILLPAATMREKVLVIGASLAVAVAGLTGVGAWRSPRRFGLTMFAGGQFGIPLQTGGEARLGPKLDGPGIRVTDHEQNRI
jgi:uncharacterized membrane protein YfcA